MSVITRFPPSPTGQLHIGRARTALFNYLFTQKNKGKMVFRVEDTDTERSKKEYEENIIDCLKWLGIRYDEGPIRQSERSELYKKYLRGMIDSGHAYVSKEEVADHAATTNSRTEVIRFKNPNKKIIFDDLIRGQIEFDTTDLKDFVIAKSLDEPLYHLAVVVDDFEMGITHIIRGEDGISNTPRQILIQEAIGASRPLYAHIPLILATDRTKLSGRHGAVGVTEYRDKGYLPEAIINFLALLGWNPGTEQELFSMDELIAQFDLAKVQKAGAVFNIEKLDWFNRQYIAKLSEADFAAHMNSFLPEWVQALNSSEKDILLKRLVPVLREKITTFGDIRTMLEQGGELGFVQQLSSYDPSLLLWKKNPDKAQASTHLKQVREVLSTIPENNFTGHAVKQSIWSYAEEKGKGDVLWPLRVALTGQEKSPDPFTCAAILGPTESLRRIDAALAAL